MNLIYVLIFATKVWSVYSLSCKKQYIKRGHLCCLPVFNCGPGHFIAPCSEMHGSERCTTCPSGHVQPDFISSLDNKIDCFLKKRECTAHDLTYSDERNYCYPKYCKCNKDRCYKDDHCVCVKVSPCPANQTMDAATGACVQCPKFSFKHEVGCGPCTMDTKAWINDRMLMNRQQRRRLHKSPSLRKRLRHIYRKLRRLTKTLRRFVDRKPQRTYNKRLRNRSQDLSL